jgi:tRNA(fMet)-specific endonuclease VapC
MRYLLDTNIVSYIVKNRYSEKLEQKMRFAVQENLYISVMTEAELLYGIKMSNNERLIVRVHDFLKNINILNWDRMAAQSYGELKYLTRQQGITVAELDLQIASHAKAENMVLVSNDAIFNALVAMNLQLENWYA